MTPLTNRHKQLLFDYSLGVTSESETAEAEGLVASSPEAAEIYRQLKLTFAPLDTVEVEPCPDELTDRLFARIHEMSQAGAGPKRLEQLLAGEQAGVHTVRIPLWRNWTEVVTAAAVIALFVSILLPSVRFMRQKYWQATCGTQLGGIYEGLRNYVSDHDGLLPTVAMAPGSPWWKVGYQGKENHSNTRRAWLLVKGGYVLPGRFLCPGRRIGRPLSFDGFPIQNFSDFPSRAYIHFSMRIGPSSSSERDLTLKRVLMADLNPLSEGLPSDYTTSLRLPLVERLMTSNSKSHGCRGQNALLHDGSVEFTKERHTSLSQDDIYLLRDMSCGMELCGCEVPSSDSDIFLAP